MQFCRPWTRQPESRHQKKKIFCFVHLTHATAVPLGQLSCLISGFLVQTQAYWITDKARLNKFSASLKTVLVGQLALFDNFLHSRWMSMLAAW